MSQDRIVELVRRHAEFAGAVEGVLNAVNWTDREKLDRIRAALATLDAAQPTPVADPDVPAGGAR